MGLTLFSGLPVFGCEFLKLFQISAIRLIGGVSTLLHQLVDITGENRSDRVQGVVTTEPLRLKARERVENHCFTQCQLVLHDDVDDRVKLSVR